MQDIEKDEIMKMVYLGYSTREIVRILGLSSTGVVRGVLEERNPGLLLELDKMGCSDYDFRESDTCRYD
jgi:transposase